MRILTPQSLRTLLQAMCLFAKPSRHLRLLTAAVSHVLQAYEEDFRIRIEAAKSPPSLHECLECIGFALVREATSEKMIVVSRLISSESVNLPMLGILFFESSFTPRKKYILEVLPFVEPEILRPLLRL